MPKINLTVPHRLAQQEALRRLKEFFNEMKTKHAGEFSNLTESWSNNTGKFSFKAKGISVNGTIVVNPSDVGISGDIPSKIESSLKQSLELLLK